MVPDIMCAAAFIYTYGNTQSRTKYINCVCVSVCFFFTSYIYALNGDCARKGQLAVKSLGTGK